MIRQAIIRPGYELPHAPGVRVHVSGVSGGSTWATVEGDAENVRRYLAGLPAPAPSTWDGGNPRTARVCYPAVILQPEDGSS